MRSTQKAKDFEKLYCTQLLLKYWPELSRYCESITPEYARIEQVEMQILIGNMFQDPETYLRSLATGKQRTQILLSHIKKSLEGWQRSCGSTPEGRLRRRIIRGMYLESSRKTVAQLAKEEQKPRGIIGKYQDSALRELTALLFGADGLLKTREAMYLHTFESLVSRPKQ